MLWVGRQAAKCSKLASTVRWRSGEACLHLDSALPAHLVSATLTMSKAVHSWSLSYIGLKITALLLRAVTTPAIWLGLNYVRPHRIAGVVRRVEYVPSRDAGRTIRVHVYEKEGKKGEKKPVLVNFHGSGFVIHGLGADDAFCAQTAASLNCVVIDSNYRKAPEWPFPAGVQDAEDVTLWALSQRERFDVSRVSLSGFSAGGNFSLSVSATLGPEKIRSVTAFYPSTDKTLTPPEKRAPDAQPTAFMLRLFVFFDKAYIVSRQQASDPRISVIRASPERFPNTVWLLCGGSDILHNDSQRLVQKLKESGHKDATFVNVPHQIHAFDKQASRAALANECYAQAAEAIARAWKED